MFHSRHCLTNGIRITFPARPRKGFPVKAKPADLGDLHDGIFGLPAVEGAFADPMATAEILGGCSSCGLLQDGYDLPLGEPFTLHGLSSLDLSVYPRRTLCQIGLKFGGQVTCSIRPRRSKWSSTKQRDEATLLDRASGNNYVCTGRCRIFIVFI